MKQAGDLTHLELKLSDDFYREFRQSQLLASFFGKYSFLRFGLRLLATVFPIKPIIYLRNQAGNYASTRRKIASIYASSDSNPLSFDSDFGYKDEIQELEVAKYYKNQLIVNDASERSESLELYERVIDEIAKLLSDNPSIKKVVNFGVSYAYVDSVLASRFPDVTFIGLDRSKLTKKFNEENFGTLHNLKFEAVDIFDFLNSEDMHDSVLIHIRTCVLLPKVFIEKLYKMAKENGVRYVVGFEQVGLSRQTKKPYIFSFRDQESVVYRIFMMIHNYPGILVKCGFSVKDTELIRTRHRDEDYRIIFFLGEVGLNT